MYSHNIWIILRVILFPTNSYDFYVVGNSAFTRGLVASWYNLLQAIMVGN